MSNKSKDKRTLAKNWPKNEVIRLIELYEARPDLWDPSRPKYVDRLEVLYTDFVQICAIYCHLFQSAQRVTIIRNS